MNYHSIAAAAAFLAARTGVPHHDAVVVLGSGVGDYGTSFPDAIAIPYEAVPGFPVPKVAGHGGTLVSVTIGEQRLLLLSGRVHAYEGWEMSDVVFGVRTAVTTGAKRVLLTNAAGGVNPAYSPGDLVIISDHLNLTGRNPLVGPNDDRLGPRFPDMTSVYTPRLRRSLADIFKRVGIPAHEGTYAWFLGPSYETPAEVNMARIMGADLVGMSTVPEAIAATHMGAEIAGISLVTNLAAGISPTPLSHDEVTAIAARAKSTFGEVLDHFLPVFVSQDDP
ncbi:MAG: purine-nucleoside phosphorylase [Acidimicrobiia bacterium]|nr:MAG: purine-nucleoside phosphorylase [Acidimicrobiia bacterium]